MDASEAHGQLQQGANFAARVALQGIESVCHPILFYGKRIHQKQLRTLNRLKVSYRGQRADCQDSSMQSSGESVSFSQGVNINPPITRSSCVK